MLFTELPSHVYCVTRRGNAQIIVLFTFNDMIITKTSIAAVPSREFFYFLIHKVLMGMKYVKPYLYLNVSDLHVDTNANIFL